MRCARRVPDLICTFGEEGRGRCGPFKRVRPRERKVFVLYVGVFSASILGLLLAASLLRGRCQHCGVKTYFRKGYCPPCSMIIVSYGDAGSGGNLPAEPAHWTAAGSGATQYENLSGGGFGVPLLL